MTTPQRDLAGNRASIRLWPGVVAAVLLWVLRFGVKAVVPGFTGFSLGLLGAFAAAFVILVWWMVFSISLVLTPLAALGIGRLVGLQGAAFQAGVLQASMPTAVITTILALEFDALPDSVTSVVFVSTLLSPFTVTLMIAYLKGL